MTGLRALRQERGLTLEALAFLADVDIASISRIERGLARPRKDTVVRLAKALGIAVAPPVDHMTIPPRGATTWTWRRTDERAVDVHDPGGGRSAGHLEDARL